MGAFLMPEPTTYEQAAIAVANKTLTAGVITAAASGAAVKVSWLSEHAGDVAAACSIVGASVAVLGLLVTVVFQIRRDLRECAESKERRKTSRRYSDGE